MNNVVTWMCHQEWNDYESDVQTVVPSHYTGDIDCSFKTPASDRIKGSSHIA